jgi:hypothetical protein
MKNIFTIVLLFVTQSLFSQFFGNYPVDQLWMNVGNPGFASSSITFKGFKISGAGLPIVGFQDPNSNNHVSVMEFSNSTWSFIGSEGFSSGTARNIDLCIGNDNQPIIVFSDGAFSGKLSVMKYNGSSWSYLGTPGFTTQYDEYFSIAVNSSGTPYVAFLDGNFLAKVSVVKYNGNDWENVGSPDFSNVSGFSPGIVFNPAEQPCIGYIDAYNQFRIALMAFNGSDWENWGPDGPAIDFQDNIYVYLAIDKNGVAYVPFEDPANNNYLSVAKFDGTSWATYVNLSTGTVNNMNICISPTNIPTIVYCDDGNQGLLYVKNFDGTSWNIVGNGGFSTQSAVSPVLSFNPIGEPYVAFISDPLLSVMYYPFPNGIPDKESFTLSVFPNPCSEECFVNISNKLNLKSCILEIYNSLGIMIFKEIPEKNKINLRITDYPCGAYFLVVRCGDSITSKKIIKI